MKRILLLAFLSIAATCLALAPEKNPKSAAPAQAGGGVQDEIKKLEQERNQAIVRNDAAALDRMSSADYAVIDRWGNLVTKAQMVEGFKSGATKFESRELSDLNVRVYGNTAVVTGRVTQKETDHGKDASGEHRFTRVLVKEKGNWVSVAFQITPVTK